MGDKELRAKIAKLKKQKKAAKKIILKKKQAEALARKQKMKRKKLEMEKRRETASLKKELSQLKNPRTSAFKKNLRRAVRIGGGAASLVREDLARRKKQRGMIPMGEVQFKKVKGGFRIFIAGKSFESATDKRMLLSKVNMIRKLQGKKPIRSIK